MPREKKKFFKNRDVTLFIRSTDKGKVIRAINTKAYDSVHDVSPVIIEEIQVFGESQAAITNLRVVHPTTSSREEGAAGHEHFSGPRLIVVSNDEIQTLPLTRCHSKTITTCSECVALQDPYCAWNSATSRCVAVASVTPASAQSALIQSILTGYSDQCPDNGNFITASLQISRIALSPFILLCNAVIIRTKSSKALTSPQPSASGKPQ